MNKLIQVENLTKKYDEKTIAVKDISFSVDEGSVVAIIGRSGSGKSTLLQMLGLLDYPTEGVIHLDHQDVSHFNDVKRALYRRTKIGIIYQNFNLLPEYSIKDNICLPLLLDKKKVDMNYFNELVNLLGLNELLAKQPYQLSGGEQQRVAIARAFIIKPMLILADEPTGNLDKINGDKVIELILNTAKVFNTTVIYVTHDIVLAKCADVVMEMSDGQLI
ncbi:ABC transporter ATP-binding protein [Anaerorhabdus furcosa]|uniref:Putative ABC transport system ATP-binding protein n=1 Tax=Anaerorhabdus furcosa TaxID=118967 RepID=A0A1T4K8L4_9FIRM|nr:ABC transporter ATP-binding protein [Anaerorhabdus furcosa]SJZ38751.1 putative ABC transport system ATP-binding protein [Anaerorhabdus furcosa]